MIANIFTTIIVQPIFNLLVLIYALLPGHNFGLAIIIFTVIIRLLLWPLVKKQLNQAKAMRELAPEIKKIKAAAKGDRQKESQMTMELYKEREVNPFASIGVMIIQLPILIGLYSGLTRIIKDPHQLITFSYPFVRHIAWMRIVAHDIHKFDDSLLGFISLSRKAIGPLGVYWPAMIIVALAAVMQFLQSKQLMPKAKDSRGLRQILRDAGQGKQADQSEVNAAVGQGTIYLVPGMVFIFGLNFAAALPLYWLTSSGVAVIQQARVLREDVEEADAAVEASTVKAVSGPKPKAKPNPKLKPSKSGLKVTRRTLAEPTKPKAKSSRKKKKARR